MWTPENDLVCHHWSIDHTVSTTALDTDDFSVILNPRNRAFQLQQRHVIQTETGKEKAVIKLEERNGNEVGDSVSRSDANRQGGRQEVKG